MARLSLNVDLRWVSPARDDTEPSYQEGWSSSILHGHLLPSPSPQQLKPSLWSCTSTATPLGQGMSLSGQGASASLLPPTVCPSHNSQSLSENKPKGVYIEDLQGPDTTLRMKCQLFTSLTSLLPVHLFLFLSPNAIAQPYQPPSTVTHQVLWPRHRFYTPPVISAPNSSSTYLPGCPPPNCPALATNSSLHISATLPCLPFCFSLWHDVAGGRRCTRCQIFPSLALSSW